MRLAAHPGHLLKRDVKALLAPIVTIRSRAASAPMLAHRSMETPNRTARPKQLAIAVLTAPPDCNFPPSISPVLPLAPAVAARTRSRAQFRLGSWDSCQWPYDECRCRRRG